MSRRSKQRHEERRAAAKPSPRPSPVAQPPSNRGTFRVAQANRKLAAELPGVITLSKRRRVPRQQDAVLEPYSEPSRQKSTWTKAAPSRQTSTRTTGDKKLKPANPQPGLDKPLPRCKKRPDDNTKKSGGAGTSKDFIPWC